MGKVGDDLFGRAVKDIISSYGPHLADLALDEAVDTSYTMIVNPLGMDRIFLHCPGANDAFGADDINYDVVAQARLFHFGYPPLLKKIFASGGAQLVEIFQRVKALGVTTSLDMAVFDPTSAAGRADWVAILEAVLPYVDVFVPNIEETLFTLRRETYDEYYRAAGGPGFLPLIEPSTLSDLSQRVAGFGVAIVGFKLGDRGLYLRTGEPAVLETMGAARPSCPPAWADKELWAPCFQVDVAGTTGAGDATVAGFLAALLRGLSPEEALTMAVAVGACNVEEADALTGVRSWDETVRRVKDGWARHKLTLDAPGWHYDECGQLWHQTSGAF